LMLPAKEIRLVFGGLDGDGVWAKDREIRTTTRNKNGEKHFIVPVKIG
jgi:hypothetical protein